MNEDQKHEIYTQGFKSGKEHAEPSIETRKFMEKINTELKYIKEKLSKVPTLTEMNLSNEKLVERIMDNCEKRFASKLTERIVFAIAGATGLWGVYKLFDLLAR